MSEKGHFVDGFMIASFKPRTGEKRGKGELYTQGWQDTKWGRLDGERWKWWGGGKRAASSPLLPSSKLGLLNRLAGWGSREGGGGGRERSAETSHSVYVHSSSLRFFTPRDVAEAVKPEPRN